MATFSLADDEIKLAAVVKVEVCAGDTCRVNSLVLSLLRSSVLAVAVGVARCAAAVDGLGEVAPFDCCA